MLFIISFYGIALFAMERAKPPAQVSQKERAEHRAKFNPSAREIDRFVKEFIDDILQAPHSTNKYHVISAQQRWHRFFTFFKLYTLLVLDLQEGVPLFCKDICKEEICRKCNRNTVFRLMRLPTEELCNYKNTEDCFQLNSEALRKMLTFYCKKDEKNFHLQAEQIISEGIAKMFVLKKLKGLIIEPEGVRKVKRTEHFDSQSEEKIDAFIEDFITDVLQNPGLFSGKYAEISKKQGWLRFYRFFKMYILILFKTQEQWRLYCQNECKEPLCSKCVSALVEDLLYCQQEELRYYWDDDGFRLHDHFELNSECIIRMGIFYREKNALLFHEQAQQVILYGLLDMFALKKISENPISVYEIQPPQIDFNVAQEPGAIIPIPSSKKTTKNKSKCLKCVIH